MQNNTKTLWTSVGLLAIAVALMWGIWTFSRTQNATDSEILTESQELALDLNGQWKIVSYINLNPATDDVERLGLDKMTNYVIRFNIQDSSFYCNTDCNSISGTFTTIANNICFTDVSATEMACDDMDLEDAMRTLLPMVTKFVVKYDNRIKLTDAFGRNLVTLERIPESENKIH